MSEVFAVVEGPAEQVFVRDVLAPWLGFQGVYMQASPIGGNSYLDAKRHIVNFLKQRSDTYVTCLFDYYGMKSDWPSREEARSLYHDNRPALIEESVFSNIQESFIDLIGGRFIPYVQMHEFEALLFSYPPALAKALANKSSEDVFQAIRDRFQLLSISMTVKLLPHRSAS